MASNRIEIIKGPDHFTMIVAEHDDAPRPRYVFFWLADGQQVKMYIDGAERHWSDDNMTVPGVREFWGRDIENDAIEYEGVYSFRTHSGWIHEITPDQND